MKEAQWGRVVPKPVWLLPRIVRSNRQVLGHTVFDAEFLRTCARNQQGILIDRCGARATSRLLRAAGGAVEGGLFWVVAGTDGDHARLIAEHERQEIGGLVHYRYPLYRDADAWWRRGIKLFLTSALELRSTGQLNARRRQDVWSYFCPLLIVFDSDLSLCSMPFGSQWDPAWCVRDVIARLAVEQQHVAVAILTQRDHATINPSGVQRAFGLSGLLYFDGSPMAENRPRVAPLEREP